MDENWKETIAKIREVKSALAAANPQAVPEGAMPPGAALRAISAVERRIRRRLPPSYRAFLNLHDGWPQFFEGASLFGTRELSRPAYADITHATFAAYETPIPECGPPSRPEGRPDAMIPFGMDAQATTIFAFNPAVVRPDGEMEVIMWINELGDRAETFDSFLVMVLEMLEVDLRERESLLKKSA
ncbi:MAG TPA: SMI1/KNR4 family protein [Polyangiaceae bacterium]|nr:SMI1/KNR4 family protein [Polyangiaceae bacterium]